MVRVEKINNAMGSDRATQITINNPKPTTPKMSAKKIFLSEESVLERWKMIAVTMMDMSENTAAMYALILTTCFSFRKSRSKLFSWMRGCILGSDIQKKKRPSAMKIF
jgi:hypothetical protein